MTPRDQTSATRQRFPIAIYGESEGQMLELVPTLELSELLDHAALINQQTSEKLHYCFSALLLAFAYGKHGISEWFNRYISESKVDLAAILSYRQLKGKEEEIRRLAVQEIESDILYPGGRRTATISALDWIKQAKTLSGEQEHSWVGLRHMMGAVIFTPRFHEEDLERWHFNRSQWALEYLRFVKEKLPDDLEFWTRVNKRIFAKTEEKFAYLLTWNPDRYPFAKFKAKAQQIQERGAGELGWSTGNRTSISVGDRVFLMRQGKDKERRGLVGAGFVKKTGVTNEPHWDRELRAQGKTYNRAAIEWQSLRETPVIPLEELISHTGETSLWETQAGGVEIPKKTAEHLEILWRNYITRVIPPHAWVDSDAIPVIGNLSEFQPSKHDSLDSAAQAKIFATLMVSADVRPPFALGLLGDWGVGKTFFMRLMQETVKSIAGKNERDDRNTEYVSRAAQIEFNAWHFVDSDLWASLASHIFDGLSEELCDPGKTVEGTRRRLRRKIESSKRGRQEATAAIEAARKERQKATKALEEKREERGQSVAEYRLERLKRIWEAILKVKPDQNNPDQRNWPDVTKLKDEAERAAKRLGLEASINSAEEVKRVHDLLRDLSRRGTGLTAAFAAAFTGRRLWISGAVLVSALAVVLAWPWALKYIQVWLDPKGTGMNLLAPLLQLTTAVGGIAVWAARQLRSISSAMGYLERIQEELRKPHVELSGVSEQEEAIRAKLEKVDAEIAIEQRRIEETDRQIADAQAEIQRINAGGLVYDFIEGKVRDSRYLDRLGLISIIRQDFEKLGSLLLDWRKHGDEDLDAEVPSADFGWNARPIERIVLYIDDLDRCPPERVVQVLQAVHLILAFDLFVVVVAVDARWLERSLNETYNPRKLTPNGFSLEEPLHRFSAHNYLEKIFQIPYSIPAMDENGYRKLVVDILAAPERQIETVRPSKSDESRLPTPLSQPDQPVAPGDNSELPPAPQPPKIDPEEQRRIEEAKAHELNESRKRELEEARKRVEAMKLRDYEEQFIQALFQFIDTPRLAKRFVNIYRLLRVKAANSEERFPTFIDKDRGEYRAVLMLLAMVVGRPQVAPEILDSLDTTKGSGFRAWLEEKSKEYQEERRQLSAKLMARSVETDTVSLPNTRERRLAELQEATQGIGRCVEALIRALDELKGPSFDDQLSHYVNWAAEVGRYSLHPNRTG